jgi:outer membrane protein assembly factor BamA
VLAKLPPVTTPRAPEPASTAVAPPLAFGGARVTEVGFHADSPVDTSSFAQYVTVKPGNVLSLRDVQSSIKSLYATGDFRDIRVETVPAANGLAVTFSLFVQYRIGAIRMEGLRASDRTRGNKTLDIHTGDVLSLNAVDRNATQLTSMLQKEGYLEATVDPETTFIRERSTADVIFHVTLGPQAKVGSVTLEGDLAPFTSATRAVRASRIASSMRAATSIASRTSSSAATTGKPTSATSARPTTKRRRRSCSATASPSDRS